MTADFVSCVPPGPSHVCGLAGQIWRCRHGCHHSSRAEHPMTYSVDSTASKMSAPASSSRSTSAVTSRVWNRHTAMALKFAFDRHVDCLPMHGWRSKRSACTSPVTEVVVGGRVVQNASDGSAQRGGILGWIGVAGGGHGGDCSA